MINGDDAVREKRPVQDGKSKVLKKLKAKPTKKREPLRRPRGRRGGVKHHKTRSNTSKDDLAKTKGESNHSQRIAKFHALEKRIAQTKDPLEKAKLKEEQEGLGGLQAYQDASLYGGGKERGGESGKWCAEQLEKLKGKESKLRLLDVGALSGTSYSKYSSWIDTTSIDIEPRSSHVLQCDFFAYRILAESECFDVVALSLVINFVGDIQDRGKMLIRAHDLLRPDGYLYVVLPLACVYNSRYLDHARLGGIFDSCGWDVVVQNDSKRLTRWLCQRKGAKPAPLNKPLNKPGRVEKGKNSLAEWDGKVWKKEEVRVGPRLNNFAIVVRRPSS